MQYASNGALLDIFHKEPLSDVAYEQLMRIITESAGSFDKATSTIQGVPFIRNSGDERGQVRGVAIYNPRYEFWLISEIEESFLVNQFLHVFAGYFLIFVIFQSGMYFLSRVIDKTQKEQRRLLEYEANHDTLTKLPNRNFLISEFSKWQQSRGVTAFS